MHAAGHGGLATRAQHAPRRNCEEIWKSQKFCGTHMVKVFNEVKRQWTRSTRVEAKYTLNFI